MNLWSIRRNVSVGYLIVKGGGDVCFGAGIATLLYAHEAAQLAPNIWIAVSLFAVAVVLSLVEISMR